MLHFRVAVLMLMLSAVTSLSGCGWHLRSTSDQVMLDSLTLQGGDAALRFALEQALEDDGVLVHGASPLLLMLSDERWNSRTVAVDNVGRTTEVELTLRLTWQLAERDGKALTPREEMITVRRYQVSPSNVTGASDENVLARQDMVEEMTARLQRALATLTPRLDTD